jgi:hypothetical protein
MDNKGRFFMSRIYEIWAEGFAATGERGEAQLLGRCYGNSFREACINQFIGNKLFDSSRLTYWGCKLFDNENAARRSFG